MWTTYRRATTRCRDPMPVSTEGTSRTGRGDGKDLVVAGQGPEGSTRGPFCRLRPARPRLSGRVLWASLVPPKGFGGPDPWGILRRRGCPVGPNGLDGLSTAWFCVRSCAQPSQYVGGMVTRSVLTQVAVSLAAAALLAGCGGSDTPPAASAPSGTASPASSSAPTSTAPTPAASSAKPATPSSTTATPTAAPLPPAAKAHSKAGAEAFVRA